MLRTQFKLRAYKRLLRNPSIHHSFLCPQIKCNNTTILSCLSVTQDIQSLYVPGLNLRRSKFPSTANHRIELQLSLIRTLLVTVLFLYTPRTEGTWWDTWCSSLASVAQIGMKCNWITLLVSLLILDLNCPLEDAGCQSNVYLGGVDAFWWFPLLILVWDAIDSHC